MGRENEIVELTKRVEALEVSITNLANVSINNFGTIKNQLEGIKERAEDNFSKEREEESCPKKNHMEQYMKEFNTLRDKIEKSSYSYCLTREEKLVALKGFLVKSGWKVPEPLNPTRGIVFFKEENSTSYTIWTIYEEEDYVEIRYCSDPEMKNINLNPFSRFSHYNETVIKFGLRNVSDNFHTLYNSIIRRGILYIEGPILGEIRVKDIDR